MGRTLVFNLLCYRPGLIGGTEQYLRQLLRHVPAHLGADRGVVLVGREAGESIPTPGLERVTIDASDAELVRLRVLAASLRLRSRKVAQALEELAPDVVLHPQQSMFPLEHPGKSVLVVHDLLHLVNPRAVPRAERAFRRGIYRASLSKADRIIAISGSTKRDLTERARVPAEKIEVVQHGGALPIDTRGAALPEGVKLPFLFYPAASFAHKGHEALLKALGHAIKQSGVEYQLVLTGQRTPFAAQIRQRARDMGLGAHVRDFGFVSDEHLAALYRDAAAVVIPSEHEGFCLPAAEAVALGRPVVTSQLKVFEELGVPESMRIDFADPDALGRALERLESPDPSSAPTWDACAQRTLAVMRAAAAG